MTTDHDDNHQLAQSFSRRDFLKLSAAAAAASLLAGCGPTRQPIATPTGAPSAEPIPTDTPTSTVAPTSAPIPEPTVEIHQPEIVRVYPDAPSKVVQAHHTGVWAGEELVPEALREMLDASIAALTGMDDARAAWAALFAPDERVAIKVNTIRRGVTHVPLVLAVTGCLQQAGVPAEQIVVFDRYSTEMEDCDYQINRDGPGVRCHGTDLQYTPGWTLVDSDIRLSDIVLDCDALINMPILKIAQEFGISCAMKNHYGTFDKPQNFHGGKFERAVAELNALPPIQERTRLIIGDVLTAKAHRDIASYQVIGTGDGLLMSFDPVAHDTVGLRLAQENLTAAGQNPAATTDQALPWLARAAELGLGTNDPQNIDLVEVNLE